MNQSEVNKNVIRYVRLRDTQFDVYVQYAKRFAIPVKSLFVLSALYDAPEGCSQMDICIKAYSSKQTVSAIIKGYLERGYVSLTELPTDRRNKLVRLTAAGRKYAESIVPVCHEGRNGRDGATNAGATKHAGGVDCCLWRPSTETIGGSIKKEITHDLEHRRTDRYRPILYKVAAETD